MIKDFYLLLILFYLKYFLLKLDGYRWLSAVGKLTFFIYLALVYLLLFPVRRSHTMAQQSNRNENNLKLTNDYLLLPNKRETLC